MQTLSLSLKIMDGSKAWTINFQIQHVRVMNDLFTSSINNNNVHVIFSVPIIIVKVICIINNLDIPSYYQLIPRISFPGY